MNEATVIHEYIPSLVLLRGKKQSYCKGNEKENKRKASLLDFSELHVCMK